MKKFLQLLCCSLSFAVSANTEIRYIDSTNDEAVTNPLFVELLQLAIRKSPDFKDAKLTNVFEQVLAQERALFLLKQDVIDVFWTGTSIEREQQLTPVRFPLLGGLLGYRVMMVHKDNVDLFQNINITQLKKYTACQGRSWPDSDILEYNGFRVARVVKYDLIFKMMEAKRCDYFPRAIYEAQSEIDMAATKYPNLRLLDNLIIQYKFPVYFFVKNGNQHLADNLKQGLENALADGSLYTLYENHPNSKHLFPISKWQHKSFEFLENPQLPTLTPDDKKYWFKLY